MRYSQFHIKLRILQSVLSHPILLTFLQGSYMCNAWLPQGYISTENSLPIVLTDIDQRFYFSFLNIFTDMNSCRSQPCQHGGFCQNNGTSYYCQCSPGYQGNHCEKGEEIRNTS